ncbi:unnamed protein product [Adineta ricciae]|uniref:Uncharacterized protein n=1 Tax=Adineta ricciae TaxID=249248 RepID=A0A814FC08_ADIRI|nr:unnamed protein product [Adineta ricciae]
MKKNRNRMASNSPYADLVDRPLFGETRSRDRISFMIITAVTTVFVLATFVGMFLFKHISGTHIFLNICLILLLGSHLCLRKISFISTPIRSIGSKRSC